VNEITNKSKDNIYSAIYFSPDDRPDVKKQGRIAFAEQKCTIFVLIFYRGCPSRRAEIIPKLPDPDNAGVGKKDPHFVVFWYISLQIPFFILLTKNRLVI